MKRNDFLKQFGAGIFGLAGTTGWAKEEKNTASYLLEAEHFATKGGWTLDTQFHDELGFSYLLAHGLGRPVENASTTITLPTEGTYHVWVRTKDWVPGNWDAPGRFKLHINSTPIEKVFGTVPGWGWRSAGQVEVTSRQVLVELEDLTGFDGRCDAIYFSRDPNDMPPNEGETLQQWRREKHGLSESPQKELEFDLVIAGGGIAGCAAALAADSMGRKVALIQDRPVLGGNASSEIRVHTLGLKGKRDDILSKLDTPHYDNGSPEAKKAEEKRHRNMEAAENVNLFLGHSVYDVHAEGNKIRSVDAIELETGIRRRFSAPVFIDATGDGWIGYWAGADYRYGRESRHEFGEGWDQYGELWSPEEPDNRVMGSSVLWRSKEMDQPVKFPDVPWAMPVAKNHKATSGEWYWEYSDNNVHQIEDAEDVRDHMLRAIYGSFANAKKEPKNARLDLEWVSHLVGKRESRRLMGEYIYTMNDAVESRKFPDTVVTEKREVDVHFQRKLRGFPVDFIAKAMFLKPKGEHYYLPFRTLYSKDIDNLMMAGRCFSCSHIGLGGPRVMNTCGQMGVAVGFAAHLCLKHNTTPRGVGKNNISELRNLCGYEEDKS
ncbi:MAG: FAD-dependent oxidoreductase [Balneolaceae bacterium]|nr:FAD-dependent oxidoreductase [Balneolaceae bacterium]